MNIKPREQWLALYGQTGARFFRRAAAVRKRLRVIVPVVPPANHFDVLCDREIKS